MSAPLFVDEKVVEAPASKLAALLDSRRVKRAAKPAAIPPALTINKVPIAKPGDITVLSAQAKSGKTAFVNGIIAAAMCSENGERADTFGIEACKRPSGSVVVWIDTEQSEEDAWANLDRAGRRALCDEDPEWIRAYHLVGENPDTIRAAIIAEFARLKEAATPVWFFIIDGVTDLMKDPNSIEESQTVCTEIRAHTRDCHCPGIVVIHRNEGEKAGSDARGHIGKELNRKAAVVLSLEKDGDEVTTVWTHKSRGAPVRKEDGPRFKWSDEAQMHLSTNTKSDEKGDAKINQLKQLFEDAFAGSILKSYSQLISSLEGGSDKTKERRITEARKLKIILRLQTGDYKLN